MKNNYLLLKKRFLLLLFIILSTNLSAWAQASNVTGTVRDETGEVVPGATVMKKGTQTGTVTDIDGVFTIQASPGDVLVISFIGYTASEVTVQSGQTNYDITITTSMTDLSEVVVVYPQFGHKYTFHILNKSISTKFYWETVLNTSKKE